MSIARQLYRLQEIDLEIESDRKALEQVLSQLGESEELVRVRAELESGHQRLEELKRQQRSAEWETDDLGAKIAALERKLYSGEVKSPKELANLQHDIEGLKSRSGQLEEKTLELMGRVELEETGIAEASSRLKTVEAAWRSQQKHLSADLKRLKAALSELENQRQVMAAGIDPQTMESYEGIREHKGMAVAKVEQGICRGCRISLSSRELQRARSGILLQCSSCGRILFLA